MSEWDALSDDDRDWAIATAALDGDKCPVCGGDDPEGLCQNPRYQHAWDVKIRRCYKQRAVLMAMERVRSDPYAGTFVPVVTLNEARAKPERK
ncbi:hypothetical protein [Brachybacterium nesterenkovii]|uniref:hypothetical protein n=1 Tax=Brachybacterium nesterenkovii TaxID=47847 RepID=UPI0032192BAA